MKWATEVNRPVFLRPWDKYHFTIVPESKICYYSCSMRSGMVPLKLFRFLQAKRFLPCRSSAKDRWPFNIQPGSGLFGRYLAKGGCHER